MDYQWANVEEQQGDLCEWVGGMQRGRGRGRKFAVAAQRRCERPHTPRVARANPSHLSGL